MAYSIAARIAAQTGAKLSRVIPVVAKKGSTWGSKTAKQLSRSGSVAARNWKKTAAITGGGAGSVYAAEKYSDWKAADVAQAKAEAEETEDQTTFAQRVLNNDQLSPEQKAVLLDDVLGLDNNNDGGGDGDDGTPDITQQIINAVTGDDLQSTVVRVAVLAAIAYIAVNRLSSTPAVNVGGGGR